MAKDNDINDTENKSAEETSNWADMINVRESAATSAGSSEDFDESKVLNQDEIDTLFGRTSGKNDYILTTGVKAILNSSLASYERLPMLDIVFDRLVRLIATSLRNLTQDNVEVSLEHVVSTRFGEYLDSLTLPTLLSVFRAEEWDNYGLMSADSDLVYSMVDVLLGGRRGTAAIRIEGRPYTTIEINLMREMVDLIISDLSMAFDPVVPINFSNERLETNPRFAAITRLSNPVVVAKIRVDMEDRGGKIDIVVPYTTLAPAKEILQQLFIGERYGYDTTWENYLAERIWNTEVEVDALLQEKEISLSEISKWQVGSFLPLDISPHEDVNIYCGDIPLFRGTMGRKGENVVIKLKGKAIKDE
ncbi:MAG: flagellar motor switch protein FliM [Alphaproteobacteria bacterium]|nr:flagellar motor switch protein FliM [Alphaproteobacteria bacterium]